MLEKSQVVAGYQYLLDRNPETDQLVDHWIQAAADKSAFINAIVSSPEFIKKLGGLAGNPMWSYAADFDAYETLVRHAVPGLRPSPDHLTNFLGVKVRPEFLPEVLAGRKGGLEDIPYPANWHADVSEWASCLRSVELAGEHFSMMELGCGWGCWMNNLGVAARNAGKAVKLYGVEADEGHMLFARQALADNGFTENDYELVNGIAGASTGSALFPLIESGVNWGASALFDLPAQEKQERLATGAYKEIPVVDLAEIIEEPLDLLHVDIQGAELDLLKLVFPFLCNKVRSVFVGTHSRGIEDGLFSLFSSSDQWTLEAERGCMHRIIGGRPIVYADGVQSWRNKAL